MWQCGMPDPGVYAILGMAGFMGGSGRITLMLATLLLELTDDVKIIVPVGVACLIAMLVANRFNHGLYHSLIPLFNLPFLNDQPDRLMALTAVNTVMATKLVTLPKLCTVLHLEALVRKINMGLLKHGAYPLVNGGPDGDDEHTARRNRLVGIINCKQVSFSQRGGTGRTSQADGLQRAGVCVKDVVASAEERD